MLVSRSRRESPPPADEEGAAPEEHRRREGQLRPAEGAPVGAVEEAGRQHRPHGDEHHRERERRRDDEAPAQHPLMGQPHVDRLIRRRRGFSGCRGWVRVGSRGMADAGSYTGPRAKARAVQPPSCTSGNGLGTRFFRVNSGFSAAGCHHGETADRISSVRFQEVPNHSPTQAGEASRDHREHRPHPKHERTRHSQTEPRRASLRARLSLFHLPPRARRAFRSQPWRAPRHTRAAPTAREAPRGSMLPRAWPWTRPETSMWPTATTAPSAR